MLELKIFEKTHHFTQTSWWELTELESGEVIFDHAEKSLVEAYADEFVKLRSDKYTLLKN